MRFRREWGIRAALVVLSPITLFALLEIALRAGGAGFPSAFFIRVPGQEVRVPNGRFGERFFPHGLARVPAPHLLAERKPDNTYRIFVFGESAAMGVPEPGFSFARILELLLAARYPGLRFEVVNTAMTAINSHAILAIARECAAYEPDLFVVYMGNNEVVGPYGPGTVFTPAMSRLPLIRLNVWQRSTRTGQWIGSLLTSREPKPDWRGMEMFQDRLVRHDDPRLAETYGHFQRNLEDIAAAARRAGAPVLLSTVAVNLKDSPPFSGAAATEQFRAGQRWMAAGDAASAGQAFARARDLDELRFRADTRINALIREVATRQGAVLADAERAFGPVPGAELFYEHVHLRFAGNYLLARTIAERIQLPGRPVGEWPDAQRTAALLPYTQWDGYRMAAQMHAMMERPPFTKQAGYAAARLERLREIAARPDPAGALSAYGAATAARPDDMHLALRYAELLRAAGRPGEASDVWRKLIAQAGIIKEWHAGLANVLSDEGRQEEAIVEYQQALKLDPEFDLAQFGWGLALARQKRAADAANHYREALLINPSYAEAYNNLGLALGEPREAEGCYRAAIRLRPDYAEARNNLAISLAAQGRLGEAVSELQESIRRQPGFAGAHFNLAGMLARLGQTREAAAQYEEALRLQPDYPEAWAGLGAVWFHGGDFARAAEAYARAVEGRPQEAQLHYDYGLVLSRQGKLDEAIAQYREALRLNAGSADIHNNLGTALARRGRFTEAAEHFRAALELRSDFTAARLNLERVVRASAEGK
ncbi:MAG TPA: tetratricopeptide repeat protein [Bryobacteraceae bacterium]|nr:tetratricopeptide repeat protein [Bryobacteraceae bacterium]